MSDIEYLTAENHRRAREREREEHRAARAALKERRERVRRVGLTCCWMSGAFLSGMALVLMAVGVIGAAIALGGAALISATLGSVLYEQ